MSEPRRCKSAPKRGDSVMSSSIAAREAFEFLNAGTVNEYRGWGDTRTAARDRAARRAGVSAAQAERLWKHWHSMKSVNGDVYRCLRNKYEHLCQRIEDAADRVEREAQEIEETNAALRSHQPPVARAPASSQGEERELK